MQRLWAALAGLTALELRHDRRSTVHAALTKNEEKLKRREGKSEVVDVFFDD